MTRTLNLGILAHVDAGKTTLTERLLFAAGVIESIGSVDAGTTQTDTLALERERGITIRSAVASLRIGETAVNIIDTPGHPDFIAEVDRVLGVLDGAVLVVSAVEGVQPQTRLLMRALRRLRVPTLIFLNKIDRGGADPDRALAGIARRLDLPIVSMSRVRNAGMRCAEADPVRGAGSSSDVAPVRGVGSGSGVAPQPVPVSARGADSGAGLIDVLSSMDDELLAAYVADESAVTGKRLRGALAAQTAAGRVCPVFAGSAITGAGVAALMDGLIDLLPAAGGTPQAPLSGQIFKIERSASGAKVAYVRMFDGTLHLRDHPTGTRDRVTALHVLNGGPGEPRERVVAGQIAAVRGLAGHIRVGDHIGTGRPDTADQPHIGHRPDADGRPAATGQPAVGGRPDAVIQSGAGSRGGVAGRDEVGGPMGAGGHFAPPMLEARAVPVDAADGARLRTALGLLAEQDPLIRVRADEGSGTAVSLYGEVQKEVIQTTLAGEFGIAARFEETTTLCVERPLGAGTALERLNTPSNPYQATIGLCIEPAAPEHGIEVRIAVDYKSVPLYVYRTLDAFAEYMDGYVRDALESGRFGWPVTDCVVTLTDCGYSVADGPPSLRGPTTTASDVRKLTPIVVARALRVARTVVCEPLARLTLDVPAWSVSTVLRELSRFGAVVEDQAPHGDEMVVVAVLTAADGQRLHRMLPEMTGGEGVLEPAFAGYRPVRGRPPRRPFA